MAIKRPVDGRGQAEGAGSLSVTSKATEPLVKQGMSFPLSFRQALLRPTGAYWLDDPTDVSCKETTGQHAVDGCQLSCKQLPCQERYAEAFSSLPGPCFGLVAHPGEAGPTLCPPLP